MSSYNENLIKNYILIDVAIILFFSGIRLHFPVIVCKNHGVYYWIVYGYNWFVFFIIYTRDKVDFWAIFVANFHQR